MELNCASVTAKTRPQLQIILLISTSRISGSISDLLKKKEEADPPKKKAETRLHDPVILENWDKLSENTKEKWKAYGNELP